MTVIIVAAYDVEVNANQFLSLKSYFFGAYSPTLRHHSVSETVGTL